MVARTARSILNATEMGHFCLSSPLLQSLLSSLEGFISQLFHEIGVLVNDSVDGIYAEIAEKRGAHEIRILGNCILITDQCLTPIDVRFSVARDKDEVDWCDCKLGEMGPNGMVRTPYGGNIRLIACRGTEIEWCHHFGYDHRPKPNAH